jgi:hypothetical protein
MRYNLTILICDKRNLQLCLVAQVLQLTGGTKWRRSANDRHIQLLPNVVALWSTRLYQTKNHRSSENSGMTVFLLVEYWRTFVAEVVWRDVVVLAAHRLQMANCTTFRAGIWLRKNVH